EEDAGPQEQDARERDAHLPAARQMADVARDLLGREAEAGEDDLRARLELVAAELLEARLHLAVPLDDAVEIVAGLGHAALEVVELGAELGDLAGAGGGVGERRAAGELADVLAEIADGGTARALDRAVVGLLLAGDEAKDRRLAGAVRSDEPDLLAGVELERRVDEKNLCAV